MAEIKSEEGLIFLGPWGGKGGKGWTYKADGPIMQITIHYGQVVHSILFKSKSYDGKNIGSSVKFGGTGAQDIGEFKKFRIDSSVEQLSSISLTYEEYFGEVLIVSLCFNTNLNKYGPFGSRSGASSVSIPIEGGVITGFHGRTGAHHLTAVGIIMAPEVKSFPNLEQIQPKIKIIHEERWISLGPWGGDDGEDWAYKPDGPIMRISICYGDVIHSILFESKSCDGVVIGSSVKHGGTGGNETKTFCIDSSVEQLLSISLTWKRYNGKMAITSLCFYTNRKKHGPYGLTSVASVSIPIQGGVIAGFHGRGGTHLTAIGIFVALKVNSFSSLEEKDDGSHSIDEDTDSVPTQLKARISAEEGWISLGPWGGKGGGEWAYRPDGPIMQITIGYHDAIHSILFESKTHDGVVIGSSMKFGGDHHGGVTETFCIDSSVEQLSSISVTYGVYLQPIVIVSLSINTNLKKNGPFGLRSGAYSVSIPIEGGVIAGFHGRAGIYLDSIGIFVAPKVNSLPSSKKNDDILYSIQDPDFARTQPKELIVHAKQMSSKRKEKVTYPMSNENAQVQPLRDRNIGIVIRDERDQNVIHTHEGKIEDQGCISLGPWGGKDGVNWAYKANGPIMQISICYGEVINSILFRSRSYDGFPMESSKKVGGIGGEMKKAFCINSSEEQLLSISLTYEDFRGQVAITSLCFNTNLRKYGTFGTISGASSVSIPIEGGVLVGFHGREGTYLASIGIFVAPKVNNLPSLQKVQDPDFVPTQLKFCIDSSVERLTSISLTYNNAYRGDVILTSLCFITNVKKYGPFGLGGGHSVSIPIEGGVITGFHGRGGSFVNAIGIFVAPKVDSFPNSEKNVNSLQAIQDPNFPPTQLKGKLRVEEGWISLGPWGGNDGVNWTYKANGPIMQISIRYGQAIDSILFESKSYNGKLIGSSEKIGGTGGHVTEMFCINTSEEQLSSISLTYEHFSQKVTIISLCICTNLHKYGPFGSRTGASSLSIPIPIDGGVLTGFHGRVGTHLFAIGIFVAPKVNSLHPIQDPNSAPTQFKVFGSGVGSKLKTLENDIHSSGTTNKDDHHGGAPSPSSEMIRKDLDLVDSAFQKYIIYMDMQIREAREKLKELQKLGSTERDFDELGQVIAQLKFQIPLISNKDDHHGGALSPTSKMIRSDLILVDTAFAEAKESMYHMNVKINQAHDKFKDLQLLPSTERDSDKLRKADSDKLRKDISKLKVRIRSYYKIRSVNSNLHHKNWDNINGAKDGMIHFFHREPEVTQTGDFDGILKAFHDLPKPLQDCLLCFFKFPPMATLKRTPMMYLWIGQGYISQLLKNNGYVWDVEVHAGKIFDELIAKGFIEPIYQKCSLVPDSCRISLPIRSSLYQEAEVRGFTSNNINPLDLDLGFACGGLDGHSCLINVGEALISCKPKLFENMKHIRSLYLGRWQSSTTHHIELADAKILHGLNKLNSLTFLSLRGISMITELPTFISELNNLMILDLRACHNLEVIPDEIGLLKSLTHLDMSECYFLEYMPKSLAQLSNLQVLKGFLIGDFDNNKQSCTLLELLALQKLRKLNIYISVKELLRLQDLQYLERFEGLQKLTISWGGCSLQSPAEDIAEAFDNATLPPRLHKLDLQCFPTTRLPDNWMMPGKHMELKKLYIRGGHLCDLLEIQERQGEQWTLEILHLKYLSKLNIDWRKLRILFPLLIYLHQVECPKVTNFPCDEGGVWMDNEAINTHVQLQKYLKTRGMISLSSNLGSTSTSAPTWDDCNIVQ